MKKVVLGIVLVLVLALGGAFFYVMSIDWNKHKDKIAEQFYNSTGKYIVFAGNVNFKVFPSPYLTAANAKIFNTKNKNEKPLLDIKNIDAELSLMPLLKGEFIVNKMTLNGAVININWDDKGLNWQGDLSADQRQMMENAKMVLNSVSLRNAQVNFEASNGDVSFNLDNLNGEIMAQSVFGPFRIEGNYTKDAIVQGFAITLGKIDESMPTSLNAVLTHPKSDSYVRFDGSFQLTNKVINGNVVLESKRFSDFINENVNKFKISEEYNKPLILGFDMALNKQMIDFTNIVLKYEETEGAGSVKLPNSNLDRPNLTVKFDFADLDLKPVIDFIKGFVKKYNEKAVDFNKNIKLVADIKSVRSSYDGQNFKNFETSFEINESGFLLDSMKIVLPGNALLNVKGNVYSYEEQLYYQADVSLNSDELMRLLKWLKIEPKATATSVYKKILLTAKVAGNSNKIQVSPYKFVLDNTTFNGDVGIILGDRTDVILNVSADTLNFDNYINSIPDEIKAKDFGDRLNYRFSKLGVLNSFDMVLNADANLVIYEGLPFESVKFEGNILNGNLEVENLSIAKVANTTVGLSGQVNGFGKAAHFEEWQYSLETQDIQNMLDKFGLYKPDFDYNQFSDLKLKGSMTGEAKNFVCDFVLNSGDLSLDYEGTIKSDNKLFFDGNVEIKYPELLNFTDAVGLNYKPQGSGLGMFKLVSKIEGTVDNMKFSSMELNSGYSQFSGDLSYDVRGENKTVEANLKVNKLELDKYMLKENSKMPVSNYSEGDVASFLVKPMWNKNKLDYSPYAGLNVTSVWEIENLSYQNYAFNSAKFNMDIKEDSLNIPNFEAVYNKTPIKSSVVLNMGVDSKVSLSLDIADANVSDFVFGGKTYGLKDGKFSTSIKLESKALSEESFIKDIDGTVDFSATSTKFTGFNIPGVYNDVIKRTKPEGLVDFVNSQVGTGYSEFDNITGKFVISDGEIKIVDAKLNAKNTKVTASGSSNLKDWTMNVLFDISHDEPKFLQNYTFSMKNSMDNPDVSFDVSKLFNIFKSREEQFEADKKAKDDAQKQILSQQAEEQKKIAQDLIKSIREKLDVELNEKIQTAFSDDAKKMYEDVRAELNVLLSSFSNNAGAIDSENVTLENIEILKGYNEKILQDIEMLQQEIKDINLSDLQKQNSAEYEKIVSINENLKKVIAGYTEIIADYSSRLSKIITSYTLNTDENYVLRKKEIDEAISNLEQMNNEVVTARNFYSVDATAAEYEELNVQMSEVLEKITAGKDDLEVKVKALKEIMDVTIQKEEERYHKKIEDEENQRLIEENIGSISVKKTGKTKTVSRDLEDIKEANEEISKEEVKVIDFTKERSSVSESSSKSSSGVIKKGRINR